MTHSDNISQRSHLQIPSLWRLGFQHTNLENTVIPQHSLLLIKCKYFPELCPDALHTLHLLHINGFYPISFKSKLCSRETQTPNPDLNFPKSHKLLKRTYPLVVYPFLMLLLLWCSPLWAVGCRAWPSPSHFSRKSGRLLRLLPSLPVTYQDTSR